MQELSLVVGVVDAVKMDVVAIAASEKYDTVDY